MTLSVQVAVGASAYGLPLGVNADFARLNKRGTFSFVLPASTRGKTVRRWQSFQQLFQSVPTGPGGPIALDDWPTGLPPAVPRDLAALKLPS